MKAAVRDRYGPPEIVRVEEVETPADGVYVSLGGPTAHVLDGTAVALVVSKATDRRCRC
jgi:hypothetical protein